MRSSGQGGLLDRSYNNLHFGTNTNDRSILGEKSFERDINALLQNPHEELAYRDKFLGDENIKQLCEKLRLEDRKKLILRGNYVGTSGAKAISDLLSSQDSLIHLSLEWNQIGATGAELIAEALTHNRSLVYLDMRNNHITSEAAITMAQAAMQNNTLKTLDLRWNQIEDRGALAFKAAILERKPSLNLMIHGNLLSEATVATINEWLKRAVDNENQVEELPPKKPEEPKNNIQNEMLMKEIYFLRQQLAAQQSVNNDLQRQLDNSLLKITELEQKLARENHENLTLSETLKQCQLRLSLANDEIHNLTANFEKERNSILNEMLRVIREKEKEIRELQLERDNLKDKASKLTDENEQLKVQYEHIQQQLATDRIVSQNELKLAYSRINELSLTETKLKAENTALKSSNSRLGEKVTVLEEELAMNRKERDRLLKEQHDYYAREIEKLKADHLQMMTLANERNQAQQQEIHNLQALVTTLRDELAKQRRELEEAYEVAIRDAKEFERQKAEHTIQELKQRLDALTTARHELELRCDSYAKELKQLQIEHSRTLADLQSQLQSLQEENHRQRNTINSLKITNNTLETNIKKHELQHQEMSKKLEILEEKNSALHQELTNFQLLKQNLQNAYDKLQMNYQTLQENRITEFNMISNNIMTTLKNEFDHMKLSFKFQQNNHS